eukprot:gb/GECG01001049.1/.p1 GENE.gb/GECG01001049.1/~~gb/GECG01001049.1/.p1  ORF type:complete len:667 (+),score=121.54 gb/GECG01001049.1/:1-2001(+)
MESPAPPPPSSVSPRSREGRRHRSSPEEIPGKEYDHAPSRYIVRHMSPAGPYKSSNYHQQQHQEESVHSTLQRYQQEPVSAVKTTASSSSWRRTTSNGGGAGVLDLDHKSPESDRSSYHATTTSPPTADILQSKDGYTHEGRPFVASSSSYDAAITQRTSESTSSYDYLNLQRERNLRSKLQLMESQLYKTEQRVRTLRLEVKERDYQIQELQRDLSQANSTVENNNEVITRFAEDKRLLEQENEKLRDNLNRASSSIQSLQSSMVVSHKEATSTEQQLRSENNSLEETIEELQSKLRRQETLTYSAEMDAKSKASSVSEYEKIVEKQRKKIHELEEVAKYRQVAADIERKFNMEQDRNSALKRELEKTNSSFNKLYQQAENDASFLHRFLDNMSTELSQVVYDVESKLNSLGIPHNVNDGTPTKHKRFETSFQLPMLKELLGPLAAVSGAIDSIHPTMNELIRCASSMVSEKEEKEKSSNRLSFIDSELSAKSKELTETKKLLEEERHSHNSTQSELQQTQSQVTKLRKQNSHLEDEVQELTAHTNETTVTSRMYRQLVADSGKRMLSLRQFLRDSVPEEFSTFVNKYNSVSESNLPQVLSDVESDVYTLCSALKRCLGEIKSLRSESSYWQSEATTCKQKLQALDTQNLRFTEVVRDSLQTMAE